MEMETKEVVAQFEVALEAEIEEARRNPSSVVTLLRGRKIAQVGSGHQYIFDIENVLNLPGSTPGDLNIPGRTERIAATVIACEGLTVTISVGIDLGNYVKEARLQSNLTYLMRKLIERIKAIAEKGNPGGERIRGAIQPSGNPIEINLKKELDPDQKKAVATCLGMDTVFIWGPPGTGKTTTIGAIGEQLYRREQTLLMVSHTNIAVDQALLKIAPTLEDDILEAGRVIRVGQPKDRTLQGRKELLLEEHVRRRSEELTARREKLETERQASIEEVKRIQRSIDICKWVDEAQEDLNSMSTSLAIVHNLDVEAKTLTEEFERLNKDLSKWEQIIREAQLLTPITSNISSITNKIQAMYNRQEEIKDRLNQTAPQLEKAKELLKQAEQIEPLRQRLRELPDQEDQQRLINAYRTKAVENKNHHDELAARLAEAERLYEQIVSLSTLTRMWRRLPKPEDQFSTVGRLRSETTEALAILKLSTETLTKVEADLKETEDLQEKLSPYHGVPEEPFQRRNVLNVRSQVQDYQHELTVLETELEQQKRILSENQNCINAFKHNYGDTPENMLSKGDEYSCTLKSHRDRLATLNHRRNQQRGQLNELLKLRHAFLREWKLTESRPNSTEEYLTAIIEAHKQAKEDIETKNIQPTELRVKRDQLNERIRQIQAEISEIEEALKRVEEIVISEARIVATTLTIAYLRDSIQTRRFDTVVLDEASMAPIPALWAAASLADRCVVAVGDFKQLPPIVLSKHDLAKQWLGKDIFDISGIRQLCECNTPPSHFVPLTKQYRMHPEISTITNDLFYGILSNGERSKDKEEKFAGWYRRNWGYDQPVLLVDMESTGAWVTSAQNSRLNFLSATVCADIAEQLLKEEVPIQQDGEEPRIIIVCPYRPHAKLLDLIILDQGLKNDIRAGTAHSFQGSEADVVIVDLVNDEPHWKVAMFNPERDDTTKRLLNVAITRARHRLIIVGDFKYITQHAKKAFLGRKFVPFLTERFKRVDALDVVPAGLAARAARVQSNITPGVEVSEAARLVVTQQDFYPLLAKDLSRAARRIAIYSPFITETRLGALEPPIKAAIERGLRIYIITKAHCERKVSEISNYRRLENTLLDWGVTIVHKRGMHEKLVFIDNEILWSGSLNPLSYSDTQEIMERRDSRQVVEDYAKTLCLNELIGAYDSGDDKCPICGAEVMASEGVDEPFFWRCINDGCYTRSIDDPPLKGGIIHCSHCGGEVEFGKWGDGPCWRCITNRHHHQRIAGTHLRLPTMVARIPKGELRKLKGRFGILISNNETEQTNINL